MTVHEWGGQPLGGDEISLAIQPGGAGPSPAPIFAAAGADAGGLVIRPGHVGDFLRVHHQHRVACFRVGDWFWRLHDHLQQTGDGTALEVLWGWARTYRLRDVRLLDQLVRLARGEDDPRPRSLEQLEEQADLTPAGCEEVQGVPGSGPEGHGQAGGAGRAGAVRVAAAILGIDHRLQDAVDRLVADLRLVDWLHPGRCRGDSELGYGPLALGLEVQGQIALSRATRNGVWFRKEAVARLRFARENWLAKATRFFAAHEDARGCYQWDGGRIALTESGHPRPRGKALKRWLEGRAAAILGPHRIPSWPPRTTAGAVHTDPHVWGPLVDPELGLRYWSLLMAALAAGRDLRDFDENVDCARHPRYEVVPEIRSSGPDLTYLRWIHPAPLFEASPGHRLVVGYVIDLGLCGMAEVAAMQGDASLLERLGAKPEEHSDDLAWHLADPGVREDYPLIRGPEECDVYRTLARSLILTVLHGLDPEYAHLTMKYGNKGFTLPEFRRRYLRLTRSLCPGVDDLISDRTFEVAASKLGCEATDLMDFELGGTEDSLAAAFRNLVAGRTGGRRAFEWLRSRCRDAGWRETLEGIERGNPGLYRDLFSQAAVTPTGRIRGGRPFHQVPAAQMRNLAGHVMKAVLFELVAAGSRLVGCRDDLFVVEIPAREPREPAGQGILDLAVNAAQRIIDSRLVQVKGRYLDLW